MRILNIRSGEYKAFALFSIIIALNMLTLEATFVVSTRGFLEVIGIVHLPLLWIFDMVLILIGTTIMAAVIDRWPRKEFLRWIILGLAFLYLLIRVLFSLGVPGWGTYPALYVIAEQQMLVIPFVFWALANDLFTIQQTKRLFPMIAASGVVGGIVGNTIAASMARYITTRGGETYELLSLNSVLLLLAFVAYEVLGHKVFTRSDQGRTLGSLRKMFADGWDFVKNVEIFRYLTIVMLGMGFALTLIEYKFLDILNASFQGSDFQSVFGLMRIGQTVVIVTVQILLAGRLLNKFELKRIFMFLPAASLILLIGILVFPGIFMILLARLLGRAALYGLDEPARKSLQGLIPDEKRGRVSSFLDGYLLALGVIGACLFLLVLLWAERGGWLPFGWAAWVYLLVGVIVAAGTLWAARKMWLHYDQSMLNFRLARRKRGSDLIDFSS